MGLADREYLSYEPRRTRVGGMSMWSVTTWLIVINVAVFILDPIIGRAWGMYLMRVGRAPMVLTPLEFWGHFSLATAIGHWQVWRFLTFQFLHAGMAHLFFNMLALYFFGPLIEASLGSRKFLIFYLISGIGGAVSYLLLWSAGVLISGPWVPLVGASAGIFGILIAAARIAPDATVMLLFPPIPMKLKTLAWVLMGIALFTVLTGGNNAGGEAAHLGGAIVGLLLMIHPRVLRALDVLGWRRRRRIEPPPLQW